MRCFLVIGLCGITYAVLLHFIHAFMSMQYTTHVMFTFQVIHCLLINYHPLLLTNTIYSTKNIIQQIHTYTTSR